MRYKRLSREKFSLRKHIFLGLQFEECNRINWILIPLQLRSLHVSKKLMDLSAAWCSSLAEDYRNAIRIITDHVLIAIQMVVLNWRCNQTMDNRTVHQLFTSTQPIFVFRTKSHSNSFYMILIDGCCWSIAHKIYGSKFNTITEFA